MNKCRELFIKSNVDAVIVLGESNTFYLSGYRSSNCQIVITNSEQYFITDDRYINEAKQQLSDKFLVISGDMDTIKSLLENKKIIGFDNTVPYTTYKELIENLSDKEFVDITDKLFDMRMIKSDWEIQNIKKAQQITELGFNEALKALKEGISEIEIAALIEYTFLKNGAEIAFDSIVAFGENGATPHAHRSSRMLTCGDFVTMDIGAKYNGYCSDMTRTVAFGGISRKQIEVYNTVLQAHEATIKKITTNMSGKEADNIARSIIENKGYGQYFTHSTGHSVGIDIHEPIYLSKKENRLLKNGMVVTVEPGIYIPNLCGVRIEDTVVIQNDQAVSLTNIEKKLLII